jgi:hypothetical protein
LTAHARLAAPISAKKAPADATDKSDDFVVKVTYFIFFPYFLHVAPFPITFYE